MTGESIWTVLLSGTVGILLGGLVQAAVNRYAAFKEGKGIAAAIRAEIEALIRLWERANYEDTITHFIKRLEGTVFQPTHNDVFTFAVNPKPFQVFDSLCHKIGLLGDLSAQIVGVYSLGKAFLANVGTLWDIRERLLAKKITIEHAALLGLTRDLAKLLQEFRMAGTQATSVLAAHERRRWFGIFY